MLSETYKRNISVIKAKDPNAKFIDITRTSNSSLSPSCDLLNGIKNGKITWEDYETQFRAEIEVRKAEKELREIAKQAIKDNIYLCLQEYFLTLLETNFTKNTNS